MGRLGRSFKIIIGLLTFWQLIYVVPFILTFYWIVVNDRFIEQGPGGEILLTIEFTTFFFANMLQALIFTALTVFYLAHAGQSPYLQHKAKWIIAHIFIGFLAAPIYWYFYIWKPLESDRAY